MGVEARARPEIRKRTIAAAVGASLLVVLFVAGLAFANSIGAARVADNASSLHWANAATGTSSLTRAALAQASTFVELESEGLVTEGDVDFALEQARASYGELVALSEIGLDSESHPHLVHMIGPAGEALDALEKGDTAVAEALIEGPVETAFIDLTDSLQTEQAAIQAAINDNTAAATRVNGYVVFFLTLAIPGAAVITYWWIARRQVREYRIRSDADLEAERAVSRAKDSFIAGLSHELRTPLTSIYGFAEILTDSSPSDVEQNQEVAQIIANEAAEMTRMVDDLLAASRLESTGVEIEMTATPVADIVESAITPFERAGLEIRREPTSALVYTDGARLRHVLVNLISNAARHGGPSIGVEVSQGMDTVDIEVWDSGRGVPEDQVDNLFERFVHDGSQPLLTGSIGLGLAVASRLTSMMNGRITYQRFGGKTYFIVHVPAYRPEESEEPEGESVADVIRAMSS